MKKEEALHNFISSFGWNAYAEDEVADDATLPYITYENVVDSFGGEVTITVSLWDRKKSWTSVTNKKDEISEAITRGGKIVPYTNGAMWVKKGSPFAQRMADTDKSIRRIVLNLSVEYLSAE